MTSQDERLQPTKVPEETPQNTSTSSTQQIQPFQTSGETANSIKDVSTGEMTTVPKRSSSEVVVMGAYLADTIIRTQHLPKPQEALPISSISRSLGGKASNQAIAVANLGGKV